MKTILFYYFNLEKNERYCQGLLKTSVSIEAIQATLASKEKNLEELIETIDKKDQEAVYVEIHGTNLENGIEELRPDTLYNLATNKYVTVENA